MVLDLDDQMESVRANINYLQDNILECQQNILQMEQAGGQEDEEGEEDDTKKILDVSVLKSGMDTFIFGGKIVIDFFFWRETCCTLVK